MTAPGPQDRPRPRPGVQLRHLPEAATLCDEDGREVATLNETAAALWELCDGTTTVDEMVTAVCTLFSIEREQAARDVRRTLADLADAHILSWS